MQYKKLKIFPLIFFGLGISQIYAQNSINAAGGATSGTGGSGSYSLGQIVYTTNEKAAGSLAQGVQQPFEISVLGTDDISVSNITISVYPNPASDQMILLVKDFDLSDLSFQLLDMQGRTVHIQKIRNNQTRILMNNLPVATYFVKVTQGNRNIKTFKIIKK